MRILRLLKYSLFPLAAFAVAACLPAVFFGQATRPRVKDPAKLSVPSASKETSDSTSKEDEPATIKLDTSIVTIPIVVLDRDGRPVQKMTKTDFHIFENDVEQEIAEFIPIEVPFHVVLMLDTSRSAQVKLEDIEKAATAFIEQLRDDDEVMVVSFDDRVTFDTNFTSDRAVLIQAIHSLRTGGGTRLYDAVDKVLAEKLSKLEGRKAIVIFSDGVDTASMSGTPQETLEMVKTSDAILYPLQYEASTDDPLFKPYEFGQATRFMRRIADASGGRFYQAATTTNLRQAFSMIAHDLRYQYAVSYYPTNEVRDGSFRKIKVSVNRQNVTVRTREGYRAEQAQ